MSRFGEPKPMERIKVLPQKTIRKVASKHRVFHNMCFWEDVVCVRKDTKDGAKRRI